MSPPALPFRRSKTDPRKQSLYLSVEVLEEMRQEAWRQDRPISWIVQQAWRIARERVKRLPAPEV